MWAGLGWAVMCRAVAVCCGVQLEVPAPAPAPAGASSSSSSSSARGAEWVTTYLDDDTRVGRGNKTGNTFVFRRKRKPA